MSVDDPLRKVVEHGLKAVLATVPQEARPGLIAEVERLLRSSALRSKQRCVEACQARADLWRTTGQSHGGLPAAREVARERANEAQYLADFFESSPLDFDVEPGMSTGHVNH